MPTFCWWYSDWCLLMDADYISGPPMPQLETWRYNNAEEEAVGVGCFFGRFEGQTDSVARVKNIVQGGPTEQCGLVQVGDALCSVNGVLVYGAPLCELGKHVLGPAGSIVKLSFERHSTSELYEVCLVRGKGVLAVM